jgi:hypothetical protein
MTSFRLMMVCQCGSPWRKPYQVSSLVWEGDMNIHHPVRSCLTTIGALACTLALQAMFPSDAAADDASIKFKGGVGVIPVSSVVNCPAAPAACITGPPVTVNLNIVRGVSPAGQIWVIDKLEAGVSPNGSIKVEGKGLILAGGNNAGRPPPGASVIATLICSAAAPFTQFSTSTAGVMLSANGDFKIDDMLSPHPPNPCSSPMLLIRNAANLSWFAVGILRTDSD